MRYKKPGSPPPKIEPKQQPDEGDTLGTDAIEHILASNLHPNFSQTPASLGTLLEMTVAYAYDKKAQREFFVEVLDKAARGISLVEALKAEYRMMHLPDMPAAAKKTMIAAMELSGKEISAIRLSLNDKFQLLRQCPPPGTALN